MPSKEFWKEYIKKNPEKWKKRNEKLSNKLKGKVINPKTLFKKGHEVPEEWRKKIKIKGYRNGVGSYRKRAFEEKGKQCEVCGIKEGFAKLVVHHVIHWDKTKSGSNEELHATKNLMVLCKSCHARLHNLSENLGEFKSITPQQQIELGLRT